MADRDGEIIEVLKRIESEAKATNARLDATNAKLDAMHEDLVALQAGQTSIVNELRGLRAETIVPRPPVGCPLRARGPMEEGVPDVA
jgi:hypothetical protein